MSTTLNDMNIRIYLSMHLAIVDSILVTTLQVIIQNKMDGMKVQLKYSIMRFDLDVRKNHEHWSARREINQGDAYLWKPSIRLEIVSFMDNIDYFIGALDAYNTSLTGRARE